ncbi:MAG TPA: carboxypeptidase-like regulatory domain-containing protein, partial [Puia sp.]
MRNLLLLMGSCLLLFGHAFAQNKTITGKITDEAGKPIPSATITIKGVRSGTSSGEDGGFSLSVPPKGKTLAVSAIGWISREIEIGDQTNFNISLKPGNNTLSEVVVTSLGI